MEHSQNVVMDDTTKRVGATGAVKLGDQHEWRNGRVKNFLKKERQDHCIPLRHNFQMLGFLESDRSDDDEIKAPIYVFDDNENGTWIKEEAVVDSGAVECVTSRKRVPHLKVEITPDRVKTWRDVDVRRRRRNHEGRQSNSPLDDRFRCLGDTCV